MDATPQRLVRSVALINQKGGVGKTTTCVNLAAAIARAGRSVLLVDLDPQAHATLHLGAERAADAPSIYDLLQDPMIPVRDALISVRPNLNLLPSETDLAAAEIELAALPDRHRRLSTVLAPLHADHEFILLDCPPSLGLLTLNALAAVREVLVPMQAHFLALQGVGKLLETVSLMSRSVNPRLRVAGVVLCLFDAQTTHTQEVLEDLEGFFHAARDQDVPWRTARVYRPGIRRNIKLAECPSFGQTIFDYAPSAPGAEDYAALARTFLSEWDQMLAKRSRPADAEQRAEVVTRPASAPTPAAGS